MLHSREMWGLNTLNLKRLRCNDRAMICWICGTKIQDETPSASLLKKLGIKDITAVDRSRRLRCYGHVQHATSCIKSVTDLPLPGPREKGRPRKTLVWMSQDWYQWMWPGWHWPARQEMHGEQVFDIAGAANPIGWDPDSTLILKWIWWMMNLHAHGDKAHMNEWINKNR